jgi:energy-converting hydrogenase Eha subunit A
MDAEVGTAAGTPDVAPDVDVLAGWDPAGPPRMLDGSAPFPTDTVIAVGAMVAGAIVGVAVGGRHPLVRAKVGGILGLAGAIVARRMWRLPG